MTARTEFTLCGETGARPLEGRCPVHDSDRCLERFTTVAITEARENCDGLKEAASAVAYEWMRFSQTTDMVQWASRIIELNDRMFDLSTWLPGFDPETGEIDWDALADEEFDTEFDADDE